MRFIEPNGTLKDNEIIKGLEEAIRMYKNGEIWEAREMCLEIAKAINLFDLHYKC